ncbi:protein kinase [Streptomyces sp. NPDC087218]|uniref:protein kinase domain-containing protein n=1 Tax=Streptomyces sp. NPDC087218 TaxID=3365769 RepID=UPI0038116CB4
MQQAGEVTLVACTARGGLGMTGMRSEEPSSWRVGDVIDDRYEVLAELGRGGMGVVHRVRDREWGVDLAVKSPRPGRFQSVGHRDLFVNEAEAWVGLGLHPNVCGCYSVRLLDGAPRVFAEYVAGGSLADWIADGRLYAGELSEVRARILDVAIQMAWGLEHAHCHDAGGLVHQDVKPANVLVDVGADAAFTAKVTDFGLARARAGASVDGGVPEGASANVSWGGMTLAYASPEQAKGERVGRGSDIYSFAVSVLEMFIGGRTWMVGPVAAEVLADHRAGRRNTDRIGIPAEVVALLDRCLRHDRAARPRSMPEVAGELVEVYRRTVGEAYPRHQPVAADLRADELNNRGLSLLDLGRPAQAAKAFEAAVDIDPRHLEATYNDGLRRWRSGALTDDALISRLEAARTASRDSWTARYLLAEVNLERGDIATADALLGTVEEMAPEQPKVAGALRTVREGGASDRSRVTSRPMGWWPAEERWVSDVDGLKVPQAPRTKFRLTADGRRALVSSRKHVGLWDLHSGQCLFRRDEPHYYKEIDVSADGRFVMCGLDRQLHLWDLVRHRRLWRVDFNEESGPSTSRRFGADGRAPVSAVRLSADGRVAVAQTGGGSVTIWDALTGELSLRLGQQGSLAALSPDGRSVLITTDDGSLQLWDTTGALRWEAHGVNAAAVPASISADSRSVAMARSRGTTKRSWEDIGVWDLTTGAQTHTLTGHTRRVVSLSWSSDGQALLSGGADGTARLWELDSGRCLRTFPSTASCRQQVLLVPGARRAVAADEDGVRWWPLPDHYTAPPRLSPPHRHGELARLQTDVGTLVDAAERARDGRRYGEARELLARARQTPGFERAPHVLSAWRSLAGVLPQVGVRASWQVGELPGLSVAPCAVDLSSDGARVVSAGESLRVWDTRTGRCLREWAVGTGLDTRAHIDRPSPFTAVRLSSDQQRVLSATQDGQLSVWSIDTGDRLTDITDERAGRGAEPACFSTNGHWALTADRNKALHLWDLKNGRLARTLCGHGRNGFITTDLWVHPDGHRAVSGSWDRTVRVWDLDTGKCTNVLDSPTETSSVALSPDGAFAVSCGNDRTIRLWDLGSGTCVRSQQHLPGHAQTVRYICDGRFVAVAVSSRPTSMVQIWDPRTGQFVHTLDTQQIGIWACAFTPDGRYALTAGANTPLRLWELDWELASHPT